MTVKFTRLYALFAFIILAALSLFYLSLGSIPNAFYGHDAVLMYDEAWRLHNGQIPHHDFYINIGGGYTYLTAFFLKLFYYDATAFSLMSVCVTIASFIFLFWLLRIKPATQDKLQQYLTVSLPTAALLMILAFGYGSYALGAASLVITYGMLYNRYCYMILMVMFAACFMTQENRTSVIAAINGACLFMLLTIKIPFFAVGLGWVVLSYIQTRRWQSLIMSLIICVALFAIYLLATSISLNEMILDYTLPATMRTGNFLLNPEFLIKKFKWIPFHNVLFIASLAVVVLYVKEKQYTQALIALSVFTAELLLHAINFGINELPLLNLLTLQMLHRLPARNIASYITLAVLLANSGLFLFKNADGLDNARLLAQHRESFSHIDNGHIHGLYVIKSAGIESNEKYADDLQEGVELIQSHIRNPERIGTLGHENAFNVLLECEPPRYFPIAWQIDYSFSLAHAPDYQKTFSDTEILMVPKRFDSESTTPLEHIYGKTLLNDFKEVADSPQWILLERKH